MYITQRSQVIKNKCVSIIRPMFCSLVDLTNTNKLSKNILTQTISFELCKY